MDNLPLFSQSGSFQRLFSCAVRRRLDNDTALSLKAKVLSINGRPEPFPGLINAATKWK